MSIATYIEDRFNVEVKHGQARVNCPICKYQKSKTLSIDVKNDRVHCFHAGCEHHSSILRFVMVIEQCTYEDAIRLIGEKDLKKIGAHFIKNDFLQIPKYYKKFGSDLGFIPELKIKAYLRKRSVTNEQIDLYSVGYGIMKTGGYRIVFPIFNSNNKIVYYLERDLVGTYTFPEASGTEITKSEVLYGIHLAIKFPEIIICEGVFDVFAIGYNAVALLGKTLSEYNENMLKSMDKEYTVCLDTDAYGNACKVCEQLKGRNKVNIVRLPLNVKDPGEFRGDLREYIRNNKKEYRTSLKYA